jgi:hypothetical protein
MPADKTKRQTYPDILLDMIDSHFLEAARYLREVLDDVPDDFAHVVEHLKIGKRKAYALAQIDRSFHDLGIDRERLHKLGWTKLAMLAPYVSANGVEQLLKLAEEVTANELKRILQGEEIDPAGKVIVLYLRSEELFVFDQTMQKFGATKHPRGWLGKEAALVQAMTKLVHNMG